MYFPSVCLFPRSFPSCASPAPHTPLPYFPSLALTIAVLPSAPRTFAMKLRLARFASACRAHSAGHAFGSGQSQGRNMRRSTVWVLCGARAGHVGYDRSPIASANLPLSLFRDSWLCILWTRCLSRRTRKSKEPHHRLTHPHHLRRNGDQCCWSLREGRSEC